MEILSTEIINLEQVANLCSFGNNRKQPTVRDKSLWHVSNLIDSAKLISQGDIRYHEFEGEPSGIMSWGKIWELMIDCYLTYYAKQKSGIYIPDVELSKDDILGSLDGIMLFPGGGIMVCETKLRFTLSNEIPGKHLQQTRAYCHLLGTDLICYVSGHLSSAPPTAIAQIRIIRFTQQSIQETWDMLVNTKKYLAENGCCPNGGAKNDG